MDRGPDQLQRRPLRRRERPALHVARRAPPIYVSGFGPKAVDLAAEIGDGYCLVSPDADSVTRFREHGGGDKPVQAGTKVCYGADAAQCRKTAHELWPNDAMPGELAQILPTPAHFEQTAELVTEDLVADSVVCGPDIEQHIANLQEYADAGVDEVYIQQIGSDQQAFFDAYREHVLPRF